MRQIFSDLEDCDNVRALQLRLCLREAFALDQLRDALLWRPDGTARELSEDEKELLTELKLSSRRLIAKAKEVKVFA